MTQTITLNDVRLAGAAAFVAGTLSAQHPEQGQRMCNYSKNGYTCVVGAAMTEETRIAVVSHDFNGSSVSSLSHARHTSAGVNLVNFAAEDFRSIAELQRTHDEWCNCSRDYGETDPRAIEAKRQFTDLMGLVQ